MTPTWIESVAYELAEKIQYQMERAYNAGYDDGKGQAWSEEIKKFEIEPEKVKEAELRGAESAWKLARHLFNVSEDVTDSIYMSMNGGKGLGVAFEMSYAEAAEKYELWKRKSAEIHVGDEVRIRHRGHQVPWVVTCLYFADEDEEPKQRCCGYSADGVHFYAYVDEVIKTGRTFPQLLELMESMKEPE